LIYMRGYGQNRPGGTSTTAGNANMYCEGARGTPANPIAVGNGDTLGGFIGGGYDGANWFIDYNTASPNFFGYYATEGWNYTGTTTTQAGSGILLLAQPQWTRVVPNGTAGRQHIIYSSWTTATNAPAQLNLNLGSGTAGTAPTQTNTDGTTFTGYGRANISLINSRTSIYGVPSSDPAADNITLSGTNYISLISGRRSGASGRRNQIQLGDDLGGIQFFGQTTNSSTGAGVNVGKIQMNALETFTSGAHGTNLFLQTTQIGTGNLTTRIGLSDQVNNYNADSHLFSDKSGTFSALELSTNSNAVFASGVTVGGTGVVYPGDGQIQSYAWQPAYGSFYDTTNQSAANTTNLNLVSIGSATTSSDIVLTGNGAQVSNAGVYNIQMSIQFDNSGNNAQDVVVWLRQNGTDLANSAGVITVPGQHGGIDGKIVSSWNYLVPANANDTFYLYWQPQSTAVTIATTTVGTGTPQAPGVIFTIVRER
jgi:hypothetical protein